MMQTVIITIICHSNAQFSVGKNMSTGHGSRVFTTRKAADAYAMQLHAEAGGPDKAKIKVHDLTRAGGA
jgi:hypothetical protein